MVGAAIDATMNHLGTTLDAVGSGVGSSRATGGSGGAAIVTGDRLGGNSFQRTQSAAADHSLTRSIIASTGIDSPSLSHHRASHTWQEQKTTSVPSGSFISISMTEFCPHETHVRPLVDVFVTCPPLSALSPKQPVPVSQRVPQVSRNRPTYGRLPIDRSPRNRQSRACHLHVRGISTSAFRPPSNTHICTGREDIVCRNPSRT